MSCIVDVAIIGAGAAGLFCAGVAGQRGLKVLLIDHAPKVAEKIRISGGGRCNFTNREVGPAQFLSDNPHFCRSALAGYTPQDFIALVNRHGIAWHEKHKGQLFCDHKADDLIRMLLAECDAGGVARWQPCGVHAVRCITSDQGERFELDTDRGLVRAHQLVIATGGLSIPKIGATDFGQRLAQQLGHRIVPLRPALVPLTFSADTWAPFAALAGLSLEVDIQTEALEAGKRPRPYAMHFLEDLLFTHRGLSGPAVLQISSYWREGQPIVLDLAPQRELAALLKQAKSGSRKQLSSEWALALGPSAPQRLAQTWLEQQAQHAPGLRPVAPLAEHKDKDLDALGQSANAWAIVPSGTEGYAKAEVTAGGVDTRDLSSQTLGSKLVPGLHFIGEVVDVTGWLGGYNFQWAWASAMACARALQPLPQAT
ncbi:aminoacetone oxidase family FAD-binding enzyme [Aquabacterium fontiphilum]|uniref:NAD(P)/FAD-dependent oxidoreductase n=1 Tax=Aquabacterium fontiphilum TaxID=450365 RepID=UPI00137911F6|nr:NAD(P)/FAD-dependent oxidoreductase [Aquabacterium fontiphilum]NBD20994.1 aminoacetone oxidase family FAD-binding enzyme [Aquabacterium fontiphilum]